MTFPLALLFALGPSPDLTRVEETRVLANDDPEAFSDRLAEALDALEGTTLDDGAAEQRTRAELTLARAYLFADRTDDAAAAMDRAIRDALGETVPATEFGPKLADLYAARREALRADPILLDVRCETPCTVVVNEREVPSARVTLPAGSHRLRVEGADGEALVRTVNASLALTWPSSPTDPAVEGPTPDPAEAPEPADARSRSTSKRTLPRWLEITGMVTGAAVMGAGAVLLTIDGRCQGGGDPLDVEACPDVYATDTAGIAMLAGGGALLVTGGLLLTVDETRLRRADGSTARSSRLNVSYTFQF